MGSGCWALSRGALHRVACAPSAATAAAAAWSSAFRSGGGAPLVRAQVEHAGQAARFENARGPLSERQSAAVLASLKGKSGDIDVLEKQILLDMGI